MLIDAHIHMIPSKGWTAEKLISLMDEQGVEQAVLLQNPTYGSMNEAVRDAVIKWPQRFIGTIQADPMDTEAATTVRRFAAHPAQRIVKFEMSEGWGWSKKYPGLRLDGPEWAPVWSVIGELGLDVIIDPGPPGNNGYQIETIARLAQKYPQCTFVLEHLAYPVPDIFRNPALMKRWRQGIEPARMDNVFLGFSAVPVLLEENKPFPQTLELLRQAVDSVGADKIIWGSDAPSVLDVYAYRDLLDCVTGYADFLSDAGKTALLGGTAKRIYQSFRRLNENR